MNIDRIGTRVERYQVLFQFTDTGDRALKSFLNENLFLRVYDLIIALLKTPIDVYILDVEHSQMLERFIRLPSFDILDSQLVLFCWHCLNFDLLLQVVHDIGQL